MTTYKPGERVHVKTPPGSFNVDEGGTYIRHEKTIEGRLIHFVHLDRGKKLWFDDYEVAPIAEPTILIENAEWADAINAFGNQPNHGKGRRYTITFEEA